MSRLPPPLPPPPPMSYQHHHAGGTSEVVPLTASSQQSYHQHQAMLTRLQVQRLAGDPTLAKSVHVPTLPNEVRDALRQLGVPVRLFGENLANIRDRLRLELIQQKLMLEGGAGSLIPGIATTGTAAVKKEDDDEEAVTKYTRASQALVDARLEIAKFSLERARQRLDRERRWRTMAQQDKKRKLQTGAETATEKAGVDVSSKQPASTELSQMDQTCLQTYKTIRQVALQGSQYGDARTLSSIACRTFHDMPLAATSSWTGTVKLWDATSAALTEVGSKTLCHEDRIMHLDMVAPAAQDAALLATASLDKTAKLWKITKSDVVMDDGDDKQQQPEQAFSIAHHATLAGHASRLCQVAFHPLYKHVATTSFDYSWRLWDVATGQNLLLQDGHLRECYGVGFHNDGSLCATTDFAGVTHIWDLRTGKSIHHFTGHAKRVLQAQFHPNGWQLATAGDDGTIKLWDLRQRKLSVNVPAHSNLVTCLKFDPTGEFMASSSFDGTAKLWSCRSWKMLQELRGHEGKVTGVDMLGTSVVTSGFDKTLKLWS